MGDYEDENYDVVLEQHWCTGAGYPAVVVMTPMGHRCGYVGVDSTHPLYGADASAPHPALIPPEEDEDIGKRGIIPLITSSGDPDDLTAPDVAFDVHGGITYAGNIDWIPEIDNTLWWFGYDCDHAGDLPSPEEIERRKLKYPEHEFMWKPIGIHRTLEYCIEECESLSHQLIDRVRR